MPCIGSGQYPVGRVIGDDGLEGININPSDAVENRSLHSSNI